MRSSFRSLILPSSVLGLVVAFGLVRAAEDDHEDHRHPAPPAVTRDEAERIHESFVVYEIRRDGMVEFDQSLRLGVAGTAIKRGPVLNFLTAFQGPAGLVLDSKLEISGVERDGAAEPFRVERGSGYLTLYIGSPERELEHRDHQYRVKGRMREDWRRGPGEFSTTFDLVGSLPLLPIDRAEGTVRLPDGVPLHWFTPAITGAERSDGVKGPAFSVEQGEGWVRVWSTASMGEDRSFFLNLAWPSSTFATQSHWLLVIGQHSRLLVAGLGAVLLVLVLGHLFRRLGNRR